MSLAGRIDTINTHHNCQKKIRARLHTEKNKFLSDRILSENLKVKALCMKVIQVEFSLFHYNLKLRIRDDETC